ncbi:MAG TPA: M3 family oligoendopeptidase [Armatimonadota bacterium]|jgi:oligoendopeptidase F
MPDTPPSWDLSALFDSIADPRIEEALVKQKQRSQDFAARYAGQIASPTLTAQILFDAIAEYENIEQEMSKPAVYAGLLFAADTSNAENAAFRQKMMERCTDISVNLLFFDLEIMAVCEEHMAALLADPAMAHYAHHVKALRLSREHVLPEPEERILEEKANTAERAWVRFFDETVASIVFEMRLNGGTQQLTEPEILNKLRDPDREVRRAAAEGLTKGLATQSRPLTFVMNTLLQDKAVEDRLRGYSDPAESRHISNELDAETVNIVIEASQRNYPLVERYYNLKRRILGYDTLTHYDRYAPLFETKESVSFAEARRIILDAFGKFSPTMRDTADEFFQKNWIDAEPRKGKRGGAFCSYVSPDLHPFVFQSYMNQLDDVMTLGHELGHGVHASLSRPLGYFGMHGTLPIAELASTFGEMLVFEKLLESADTADQLALYANKIEGIFATIFRQAAMYLFERDIHTARREQGELTCEAIGEFWQKHQQAMFGDSVELGEEHKSWWQYVSHFIHTPFYVYAYTFGELLVLALYAQSKKEGAAFEPKYVDLLKAGGSLTPQDLMAKVGINLKDPAFWQGGMDVLEGFIARFETIHDQWRE